MEMEAFARPLWGLVPFWIGGGRDSDIEAFYRQGLSVGCNPDEPDFWGIPDDCDQRFVEMAPIAYALLSVPELLWDPLCDTAKRHISSWLAQINSRRLPECNWYFFRILVNGALRSLGCAFDENRLKDDIRYIDSMYLGAGWYRDGQTGRTDYYSSFAMQYYRILFAHLTGECLEETAERACLFAKDFIHWFAPDGAALPYGRSLTYRFAQSSFFSACLFAGLRPFSVGVMKGIVNRNIRYFMDRDIFSSDHIMQVGYGYANPLMSEKYNAPGSPYWALKVFAFLALDDQDPYWTTQEEPLPQAFGLFLQPQARLLIQRRRAEVTAYTPGDLAMKNLGRFQEKYYKFVYSSLFPFSVQVASDSVETAAPDSTLAFVLFQSIVVTKGRSSSFSITGEELVMHWSPIPLIHVETRIVPTADGHIREHRIRSEIECRAFDTAFALPPGETVVDETSITVRAAGTLCSIGTDFLDAVPYLIQTYPNSNIFHKRTVIPAISFPVKKGMTVIQDTIRTNYDE